MLSRLALFATLLLPALPASAQVDSAQARAKELFMQGRKHLAEGRYANAVAAFEQANAIKPHPVMLKNIARTYEAMTDLVQAVAFFDRYLASNPKDAAEIQAANEQLKATLAEWPRVSLTTKPPGASIWVGSRDNRPRGRTPATIPIPPGPQTLIFGIGGYDDATKDVRLSPKQALTLPTVSLKPRLPMVLISSTPPGADVRLDGAEEVAGRTPLNAGLPAGEHSARINLEGHAPVEQTFMLTAANTKAKPLKLAVKLVKEKPSGELVVILDTPAEVFVDGKSVGKTPLPAPVRLEAGLHTLQVRAKNLPEPYQEMVAIEAGKVYETTIELDTGEGFSVNQRTVSWGLMGLGGAVVLGGVVTSILAFGADGDLQDCRDSASCKGTQEEVDLADDVRSQALTTDILIGVGAAIAVTGVVLYVTDDGPAKTKAEAGVTRFGVSPLPGGGAAAVGRFEF